MRIFKMLVVTMLLSLGTQAGAAEVELSGFSPLYVGVDYAMAKVPSNSDGTTGAPLTSRAYVVRVNLRAPGISFTATPQSGSLETTSETTSQFVARMHVRVGVNANFFSPCCNAFPEPKNVIGTLISNGHVVSAPGSESDSQAVLAITRNNRATIANVSEIDFSKIFTAVAGSAIIVKDGVDISAEGPSQGDPNNPNPRTLAGISAHGHFLFLAVIDGRVTGYSLGTTNAQSAALMLALGCDDALNLDGGGSSEMVRADKLGQPFVVNNPSGGAERFSAAALGVHAFPLQVGNGDDENEQR
jgi:exopolysaccharide biosynthesis protein